jgi:hypothetical protein
LVTLARYVVLVYGRTWLEAKWDSRLQSGPLHLFHEVQRQTLHFSGEELDIVRNYTQINGYFAHEEQVLLYLVCSDRLEDREVGVRYILKIRREIAEEADNPTKKRKRRSKKPVKSIRKYSPRQINWQASSVEKLVDLNEAKTEPPLTMNLTTKEVEMLVKEPLQIPKYECISQFVERSVKATTEAAAVTTGGERQDAVTINKNVARSKIPNIKHKKHFKL